MLASRSRFRSIRLRLPLLIVVLLSVIVAGFGWSAHRHLTSTLERAAGTRLERAGARFTSILEESVVRMRGDDERIAADPALAQAIAHPSSATEQAARLALMGKATQAQTASRTLWSRDCVPVVSVGRIPPSPAAVGCPSSPTRSRTLNRTPAAGPWIQPFVARGSRGDTIEYDVVAPVVESAADTVGYVVETRRLASGQTAKMLVGMIGKDVVVMVGNRTAPALWTDLARKVDGPSSPLVRGVVTRYRNAADSLQFGVAQDVASTPWVLWVQLPYADVLEPEVSTLRDLGLIALACLVIGVIGASIIGRHVTGPLVDLTNAAEEFAHGNYARRLSSNRADELGILVAAFNHMAVQVDTASRELKLQAKKLELRAEEAQDLAQELELSNQELSEALEQATLARRDTTVAESLLDEVLVQAPVGIAVFDRDMRYVRVNQAVADIHGMSVAAHLGKRPREVVPALGELTEPLIQHVFHTGERVLDQSLSAMMQGSRRKRHWLSSCFPIRGADNEVTGVGTILVDNTAQQELEAQFLQAQKMEAVGRLAGGVAHDFNNLLTVITSYTTMALGALRPDEPLYDDMREIQSAADRAARLTKQLLQFSRKQLMRPQPVDLSAMATEMERMLERLIGEDVKLELVLAKDLGLVSADPGQIEQVIMNLVVNARDAIPNGGHITIETANVDFSSELSMTEMGRPAGSYVMLTVTDTGAGMSEETQANLFEPFFTTKGAGFGTGLGLSTVYGIVKQSGGDIHVRSELGHGTTFRLYFPRLSSDEAPATPHAPATNVSRGGTDTILLVEDDEPLRNLAARVLRNAGYVVLDTSTPSEAVLTGTHHPESIELLLTDVVMPEMSGRTVAELLVQQRPSLGVLYMSGYTDDDVLRRGVLATETELLQKPFTPDQLLAHVRAALDGQRSSRVA